MLKLKLVEKYIKCFDESMIDDSFVQKTVKLCGLSGAGTAQVISNVCKFIDPGAIYLEVGIYQASNLIQVAKQNPTLKCVGVDNFSESFLENNNYAISTEQVVKTRILNEGLTNCEIVKQSYQDFFAEFNFREKVQVYYFDGPHTFEHQVAGVEMCLPFLDNNSIIFIDDFASPDVKRSTDYLLKSHKELTLLKIFTGQANVRELFNQGQVCLKFERNAR